MKIGFNICFIVLTAFAAVNADVKRFDNPSEAKEMFGSVGKNDVISNGRGQRIEIDHSDSVQGDFSVLYIADTFIPKEVGFMTMPGADPWDVGFGWKLVMSIKTDNQNAMKWQVRIFDHRGGQAETQIPAVTQSDWQTIELNQTDFSSGYSRFDMSKITAVQFQIATAKGGRIWFDDVHFITSEGSQIGVSDKTIDKYAAQESTSRQERIRKTLSEASTSSSRSKLNPYFAQLYLNQNTDMINAKLLEIFTSSDETVRRSYGLDQLWHLSLDSLLIRMYNTFGSKSDLLPGRLSANTEGALLELIWERNEQRNDISLARQSSWWIVAGESSDLISKSAALLSSQIFMKEADYRDRIYPDTGSGGGYGYWFHKAKNGSQGPDGEGSNKDSQNYKAVEHYYAYVDYFTEYFRERAKKGQFIEYGSTLYAQYSLMPIYDIYSMCEDEHLRELAGKFLDVYWALWAQDQLAGIRGGARIRDAAITDISSDSEYMMAHFLMGGIGDARGAGLSQVLSGYAWPEVVWSIALDRKGLGGFEFVSRLPGEEQNDLPRPPGTERTLLCDTESRFVRYSWVTPDYILGCRMDYPTAVNSYISNSGTKYGVLFSTIPEMAIYPWTLQVSDESNWSLSTESGNYKCLQYKNVMIIQQARNVCSVSPSWYPQKNYTAMPIGIYVNSAVDQVIEKDGWIFIEESNCYAAIRVVMGEFAADHRGATDWFDYKASDTPYANINKDSYEWNRDRTIIRLKDIHSPVIIHTGRREDYPTVEKFMDSVLEAQVALLKTVVPGWYILNYKIVGAEPVEYSFNAANSQVPAVNGERISYEPEKLYSSPTIESYYKSGVINIRKDNYQLKLDFN